ncbi:phage protein, HK97 gp10 family [Kaistia soli DSM 19436]|uniref:Phage protein, HK97 gp10 family n=1 Tax=Kaistia soli DSM 19436 TaxID=1122133 RepID=A0A1M5PPV4_9HYPH|nr:HK97-gp10 family putative phage morphogenesis protein [Kaistia soli]SHH03772.1 phage protein, HK97 gp10 family [Kaistia soli DSM 19436]
MADDGGKARFKAFMAALPAQIKADIAPAVDKSADEMVSAMKSLAPSDDGDLRASIRVEPGQHELSRKVVAGNAAAPHATYVEFGTIDTPAQPYFWPIVRSFRRRSTSRINRAITAAVKRYNA